MLDGVPEQPRRLKGLTALRFVAALWVVLYHYRDQLVFNVDDYTRLLAKGYIAVDFFFILSGFIMAHVYGDAIKSGRFSHRDYLWKRFARLYPLHLVTLGGVLILFFLLRAAGQVPASDQKYDFAALPMHLLMLHAWGTTPHLAWNIPSWSISAEFAAYLLFPILMWVALRTRPWTALAGAVLSLLLGWGLVLAVTGQEMSHLQTAGAIRILPEFFLGLTLRQVDLRIKGRFEALAGVLVLVLAQWSSTDLPIVLTFAVVVAGFAHAGAPSRLVYFGEASFALYMVHALVQTAFFRGLDFIGLKPTSSLLSAAVALVGVVLAVVVSIPVHEWIEKPARERLTRRRLPAEPVV